MWKPLIWILSWFSHVSFALTVKPLDVAFLLPLPDSGERYGDLPGLSCDENFAASLLSPSEFDSILEQSFAGVVAFHRNFRSFDELAAAMDLPGWNRRTIAVHGTWRVVAFRADACRGSRTQAPKPEPKTGCIAQVRLVLQPILNRNDRVTSHNKIMERSNFRYLRRSYEDSPFPQVKETRLSSQFWADDHAIHLIYELKAEHESQLRALLQWLVQQRGSGTDGQVPWVHPATSTSDGLILMKKQLGDLLKGMRPHHVLTTLSSFQGGLGGEWAFAKFKPSAQGTYRKIAINTKLDPDYTYGNAKEKESTKLLRHEHEAIRRIPYVDGIIGVHADSVIDILQPKPLAEASRQQLLNKYRRVADWNQHTQESIDCLSCHTSTTVPINVTSDAQALDRLAAAIVIDEDSLAVVRGMMDHYPIFFGYNVRQFSYFLNMPSVSLRALIEAQASAEYFSQVFQESS